MEIDDPGEPGRRAVEGLFLQFALGIEAGDHELMDLHVDGMPSGAAVNLELQGRLSQEKARNTRRVVFRPRLPGAAMPHIAILGSHMAISGNRISRVIMTTRVMTKGAAPIITS